jgi:transcriptional regulator with XRE-family HTH domain
MDSQIMAIKNTYRANVLLRNERLLRGWSQQDLADQLGATIVTVSRWECGVQQPGPALRLKLCLLFEKSADELGLLPYVIESATDSGTDGSQESILSLQTSFAESQQSGNIEIPQIPLPTASSQNTVVHPPLHTFRGSLFPKHHNGIRSWKYFCVSTICLTFILFRVPQWFRYPVASRKETSFGK